MARLFLCLLAAACCCLSLLLAPAVVQGRIGIGPADNGFSRARDDDRRTAATVKKAKPPAWSSSWSAAARPELRSVPGGPNPLHHHGSPWRPEPVELDAP